MLNILKKCIFPVILLICIPACKPAGSSDTAALSSQHLSATVVAVRAKSGSTFSLTQYSRRSIRKAIVCNFVASENSSYLKIVPSKLSQIESPNGVEYFIRLQTPVSAEQCKGAVEGETFSYGEFFVSKAEVEVVTSELVTPAPVAQTNRYSDDFQSRKAESLAYDMERRRSGGGKPCGLTSFGNRGCWACVGWAMTDNKVFPEGLGSGADSSPNGFLRATANLRARKAADGTIHLNGIRFRSLMPEYRMRPSLAPRGSILFCNTSAEGHAAIVTHPGNEMRSDVIEIIGANWRQSLCWDKVEEILFPLD